VPCPFCRMIMGSFRCRVVEKQRDHQLKRAANALAGPAKHAQDEKRHEDACHLNSPTLPAHLCPNRGDTY